MGVHVVFSKVAEKTSERLSAIKSSIATPGLHSLTRPQITAPVPVRKILPAYDRKMFFKHLRTRFPRYQEHFQNAAEKYNLPWKLLASQAYQESHWNRRAKSPTGVRGIMMLTRRTAASLGIRNRLDPEKSIYGGARFLARMQQRIPTSVPMPDRRFFALAAYNVGLGHMEDARELAQRIKKNPDHWQDMTEVLPLLSQKKYYRTLRYGKARGHEPVIYVRRIRAYQVLFDQVPSENSYVTKRNKNGNMKASISQRFLRPHLNRLERNSGA
ncbi:transglycosylase SLT domain-containing protein [Candidatus Nitronereus thalassa]|uniref:Transglycosylase SLT domain-containing protein n=1 Tax=Candidatus Nitronereus thalassa TaxID=3020898 RepID=A0ABU3KC81_9BACT|nr:transglycosylase SLT domain-containing protein [Candidatus Nitronereus thalassa]MDT7043903.1 transglycosylase SLT domain-containing protein [Candidatus Nitronereus thalassa]